VKGLLRNAPATVQGLLLNLRRTGNSRGSGAGSKVEAVAACPVAAGAGAAIFPLTALEAALGRPQLGLLDVLRL